METVLFGRGMNDARTCGKKKRDSGISIVLLLCFSMLCAPAGAAAVFSGQVLDAGAAQPSGIPGVAVTLSCADNPGDAGIFVAMAVSGRAGDFSIEGPDTCEFFNIILTVPEGGQAVSARSTGGTVNSESWIQYTLPLTRKTLSGNIFLVQEPADTAAVSSCPAGCTCTGQEEAALRFLYPERCAAEPCGGTRTDPWYCFHEGTAPQAPAVADNVPPVASLLLDPPGGPAPLTVGCSAASSYDTDGRIVSYTWDFGDGTAGSGTPATHTYLQAGSYTVTLTVTDDRGATGSARGEVRATEAAVPASAAALLDYKVLPEHPGPSDRITVRARYTQDVAEPQIAILVNGEEVRVCPAATCEYTGGPFTMGAGVTIRYTDAAGITRFLPEGTVPKATLPEQPDCDEMVTMQLSPEMKPFTQCKGDGFPDPVDNCPKKLNHDQKDTDKDGAGDVCDNCPVKANAAQKDTDKDGAGDACDRCPGYPDTQDIDSDGEPDACDCSDGVQGPQEARWDCGGICPPCDPCSINPLPDRFDWRDWRGKNWLTPVKDQASCGSCWAFAPLGVTEARYHIEQDDPSMPSVDLSEQYLVSFHVNPGNTVPGCCNGGLDGRALTEIRDTGVIDDMLFAYQSGTCLQSQVTSLMQGCNMSLPDAKCRCAGGSCTTDYCDPSCAHNISGKFFSCAYPKVRPTFAPSRTWTIGSFSRPTTTTGSYAQLGDTVKRAVLCSGPLSASSNLWPGGAHVIVITGWNNTWNRSSGAWIVKNSWGANWIAGGSLGSAGPGYAFVPYNGPVGEIVNWTFGVRDVRVVP